VSAGAPPQRLLLSPAAYELRARTRTRHPDLVKIVAVSIPPKRKAAAIVSTGYSAGGRQNILDQFGELGTNVIIVTHSKAERLVAEPAPAP
jgi:hypothetical protein